MLSLQVSVPIVKTGRYKLIVENRKESRGLRYREDFIELGFPRKVPGGGLRYDREKNGESCRINSEERIVDFDWSDCVDLFLGNKRRG